MHKQIEVGAQRLDESPDGVIEEDATEAQSRAAGRRRRIARSAVASALAKVTSVGTALISVPLTLNYLGPERFGMWMTMSSLVAFLSFADFGLGNGLLSAVAAANGRDDRAAIKKLVSSAYFVLSLIAVAILCMLAVAYPLVPWYRLFNVQSELARSEVAPSVATLICCFAAAVPLGVVQRTQLGLQQGYMASLWQCGSSLLGLGCVLFAIKQEAPLPVLILAYVGGPLVVSVANGFFFFGVLERDIAPSYRSVTRAALRAIGSTGLLFLTLQFVAAATYMSDSIIIAQMLGASAVTGYAVPEKLFSLIGSVLAMGVGPLWAAHGEAIARGDREWALRTLKVSMSIAAAAAATASLILVPTAPWLLKLWVGHAVSAPFFLLLGLGVWKVLEAAGLALAMFLNGARIVGFQVAVAVATALLAVTLKMVFVHEIGIAGSVWATIVSYAALTLLPYYVFRKRILMGVK
jgi:O-antigen/teichoic acid export membrane protein